MTAKPLTYIRSKGALRAKARRYADKVTELDKRIVAKAYIDGYRQAAIDCLPIHEKLRIITNKTK